ncbi:MAG TPA: multiheme c-type cytochrome [Bryobacteraceae bacterium]|nr:multiheme c-type cytochrome [Bryobacteraceae bacterium]
MPSKLLSSIFFVSTCVWAAETKQLRPQDFASAETCNSCHTEIYQQWRTSFHSQAATDSLFWRFFQQAVTDVGSRASALCLTCHAPVATVGRELKWFGPVSSQLELSPVAREGVTCDFCHTVSGSEELGRNVGLGVYRVPHKGDTVIKYGSHADAKSPAHATQPSAFLRSSRLCAICHQSTHSVRGLEIQNTYSEFMNGPYRAQGRECQHCHMPAYTGRATNDSPERPDIRAHVFLGGHTEMLKKAALVSLGARVAEKSGTKLILINAIVTNAGSGHLMPTGIPGMRQLWLEVAVNSPDGAEVFTGRSNFGLSLLGQDGSPAMPWNAVRVKSDTRIAPQRSRRESFEFKAPNLNLEARARVYYRLISEQAAKTAGLQPSPPVEVAKDQMRILSDGRVEKIPVQ